MKVKELQKTVNVAWSPIQENPIMLAAGTAAQQLDATFSSTAMLEVYAINLAEPGYDLELKGSQPSSHKFHNIVWSPFGYGDTHPNGLIAGGCENGVIQVYSASKLLAGDEAIISQQNKHSGPVHTLDYNPFQSNLLASGASESEIFIWDLNNTNTPMTPGTKTQPFEDVLGVAWNRQVQHILASVFPSRCVIWDLRKNEPIIKLSDTQSRVRWRVVQWHPEVATQLWLASEEDQAPSIQLWDLRYATAPAKTFNIHQRGVLGMTWCPTDTDLMASCGKDNKIYCWNPNSDEPNGEVLSEIATTNQWNFDVSWCPRNPALIVGSSFDGNVSIYSLFGGSQQQVQTSSKIADSFPGMDAFDQAPAPQVPTQAIVSSDLKRAPKCLKKSVGATFGFGGKLVTFNNTSKTVTINQIVTDPELVERSNRLEEVLAQGNYSDYCRQKADQTNDQHSRFLWYFLKANFEDNPHGEMLNLLGYQAEDIANKFKKFTEETKQVPNQVENLTDQMAGLSRGMDNNTVFDAIAAGSKLLADNVEKEKKSDIPFKIKTGDDHEGLICEALLTGNLEAAVELCMESGKTTEALILARNGGSELLARIQYRYLKNNESYLSNIISALVTEDWSGVITQCTIDSWKEALVAALTHCKTQLPLLCERLGERLQMESSGDSEIAKNAILCYICAGSTERLVEAWNLAKPNNAYGDIVSGEADTNNNSNRDLQELVEVVMLLQKALEKQGRSVEATGKLAELLSQYAGLLAAQGSLTSALTYLGASHDPELEELRERLYYALGHKQVQHQATIKNSYFKPKDQQQQQQQQQHNRFTQPRSSFSNPSPVYNNPLFPTVGQTSQQNAYYGATPSQPPQSLSNNSWNTFQTQAQPDGYAPFNPVTSLPPMVPPPVLTKPPVGPPPTDLSQPARPSSVGSQSGASMSRSKYILDPSVQSGPSYGQTPSNLYNPTNFNTAPGAQQQYNQYPQSMNPMTQQPQPTLYNPNQQNNFKQFTPAPIAQSGSYMGGVPPVEIGQPALQFQQQQQQQLPPPPQQQMQRNPTPPPGWNDPPALKTNKPPQPKQEFNQMNPIMHPLFGQQNQQQQNSLPDANGGNFMGGQFQNQPQQQQPIIMNPGQMPQQQQMPPTQQINYQNFQQSNPMSRPPMQPQQPQQQQQQQQQQHHSNPEPPKQKPPLPEEFVYLQTVFEELKKQCINAAGNPQTKRKLEDVSKRLESLYDLLRENRLSQNTLGSLNQLVQLIQIGDYGNGIGLHTQMVSGSDFAQIASFMPGIKVLLQSAMQLQVYLR